MFQELSLLPGNVVNEPQGSLSLLSYFLYWKHVKEGHHTQVCRSKCWGTEDREERWCIRRLHAHHPLNQCHDKPWATLTTRDFVGSNHILCHWNLFTFYFLFLKILFIFRESGREGERDGEKHQCMVVPNTPPTGTWPATQASALTGNPTGNPLV